MGYFVVLVGHSSLYGAMLMCYKRSVHGRFVLYRLLRSGRGRKIKLVDVLYSVVITKNVYANTPVSVTQ